MATLEEIKAGLGTGQIRPEWGVKGESGGYWITIHELIYGPLHPKSHSTPTAKRPMKTKLVITTIAIFVLTCLFPPWQYTVDRNGSYGYHSRKPAGYSLLFNPPTNPDRIYGNGVQVDFGRLFLEWTALAAVTGVVWILVVKPAWARDDKPNRSQKFVAPPGNPEN